MFDDQYLQVRLVIEIRKDLTSFLHLQVKHGHEHVGTSACPVHNHTSNVNYEKILVNVSLRQRVRERGVLAWQVVEFSTQKGISQ